MANWVTFCLNRRLFLRYLISDWEVGICIYLSKIILECRPGEENVIIPSLSRRAVELISNSLSKSSSSTSDSMPPPFEQESFYLTLLPNAYFVKQLPASADLPETILSLLNGRLTGFFSITRTPEEVSVVGEVTDDPRILSLSEGVSVWRCIKIAGPMEFGKQSLPPARSGMSDRSWYLNLVW